MSTKVVHVAVGVVENPAGEILISRRAAHQHQGNLWEFPGGKVEAGESVQHALARELLEEMNIEVTECAPLTVIEHAYPDKRVRLDVWQVTAFNGQAKGLEGQEWLWVARRELDAYPFPAGNVPILERLLAQQP
ncbi:8-oxo-dGTP diphosphatase MutT [Aliidiomarina maris]|uniref:8-oxo-dGTP diphosphatase n=1 Tax=Aliidiomarina maris TaxID=531312 RepID=A0A327WSC3_9GAMM|nr:8-oxo-dGTP diphosphatase MutT [Aliidiomarina maris]MCL5049052.1 8-oxo-dGTP diphosphatase MutT [Bacillota bacterium]RAJ93931.1 8-oxo-dGTPase [Aliidiomarina maris]RUO27561.1 8-oxo-dGTP diphosphatase MutT [Aliidiomarina maris]